MAMRKEKKRQTIEFSREKRKKDKQYNGQEKGDKRTNFSFLMTIVLSDLLSLFS
jgi:hypothetical protein